MGLFVLVLQLVVHLQFVPFSFTCCSWTWTDVEPVFSFQCANPMGVRRGTHDSSVDCGSADSHVDDANVDNCDSGAANGPELTETDTDTHAEMHASADGRVSDCREPTHCETHVHVDKDDSFNFPDVGAELLKPVDKSQNVAPPDPISQFASAPSDPISQFSDACGSVEFSNLFGSLNENGLEGLGTGSQCGSDDPASINSAEMRRCLGSGRSECADERTQHGEVASSSSAFSREARRDVHHDVALEAFARSLQTSAPKFMWESDNFLNTVFNSGSSVVDTLFKPVQLKRPAPAFVDLSGDAPEEPPVVKALRRGAVKPVYLASFSKSSLDNEDSKRKSFVSGWVTLVLINRTAFNAFTDALSRAVGPERETINRCLVECFAAKATSTVGKRLGSMSKYASFCEKCGIHAFPLSEKSMYAYLSELYTNPMSSASSGRSFLEAVRFSASLLGLHGLQQDRVPQRVSGLAEMLARKATTLKQASPLSVLQVSKLEELCCTSDSINDRAIIGGILTMLYSCARASDAARVVQLVIDRVQCGEGDIPADGIAGYIEAGALHTKGARSQVHKRSLLPLVAPMAGVSGWRWWDSFLQAREALGLQIEGKLSCPLMCRFDEQGQAVPAALQASEIGCFLRNVLKIPHEKTNAIRSHSLKVTPLSWTAKAGSSLAIRRSLGHHLDTNARSATIYARDAMAPPLRELCRVIQLIASKEFFPDNTRSGRFRKEMEAKEVAPTAVDSGEESEGSYEMPFSERLAGDTESSNTDASSDADAPESDSEVLDTTTLWDLVEPKYRPNLVKTKEGFDTWMHCQSRVLHLAATEGRRFVCGRQATQRYTQVLAASSECTRCQTCYTNKSVIEEAKLPDGSHGNGL